MKQLTKKQKVFVLKEMIRYYKCCGKEFYLMCYVAKGIIRKDIGIDFDYLTEAFPEFVPPDNASDYLIWFDITNKNPRIKYLKGKLKLIESK